MFDIGFWEILVIGVMALLVLGPERLPGAIRSTARTVRRVKNIAGGFKAEIDEQLRIHELHENLKKAESMSMQNLSPDLQKTVDELKAAAESVQRPYKQEETPEEAPENTIADPTLADKSKSNVSTRE